MASSTFQKKASGMLVTVLIGLIVVSFMFSGYQSFKFSSNSIGKVGDYEIKGSEYQNELSRTIKYYSQMMGGKNLTSKDIERFALKKQVLRKMIDLKLRLILSDSLHIEPAADEISDQIQKLPYFLDKGVFSLSLYKNLLKNNGLTPQAFEQTVHEDLKIQVLQQNFGKVPVSSQYLADLKKFKTHELTSVVLDFNQSDIQSSLPIKPKIVKTFLSNKDNFSKVEKLFSDKKKSLSKPAEIEAAHILLKTTPENEKEIQAKIFKLRKKLTRKNFARMAEKNTEDPSGKSNGGDLGRFGKGRMVKEFENAAFSTKAGKISQPIKTTYGYHIIYVKKHHAASEAKFGKFKNSLAKDLIRKTMDNDAKQKMEELTIQLEKLLKDNKILKVKKLAAQYNIRMEQEEKFNRLDGYLGKIKLDKELLAEVFKGTTSKKSIFTFTPQGKITIVKAIPFVNKNPDIDSEKKILAGQEFLLTKTLMAGMLSALEKKVKVNIRQNVVN